MLFSLIDAVSPRMLPLYRLLCDSLHGFDGILACVPMSRREVHFATEPELIQTPGRLRQLLSVLALSALLAAAP